MREELISARTLSNFFLNNNIFAQCHYLNSICDKRYKSLGKRNLENILSATTECKIKYWIKTSRSRRELLFCSYDSIKGNFIIFLYILYYVEQKLKIHSVNIQETIYFAS
jgi:hypothetical protein